MIDGQLGAAVVVGDQRQVLRIIGWSVRVHHRDTEVVPPEVFCLESIDTPGNVHVDLVRLDDSVAPREEDGAVLVRVWPLVPPNSELAWPYAGRPAGADARRPDEGEAYEVALRPYHTWGNRGPTTMRIWLPTDRT